MSLKKTQAMALGLLVTVAASTQGQSMEAWAHKALEDKGIHVTREHSDIMAKNPLLLDEVYETQKKGALISGDEHVEGRIADPNTPHPEFLAAQEAAVILDMAELSIEDAQPHERQAVDFLAAIRQDSYWRDLIDYNDLDLEVGSIVDIVAWRLEEDPQSSPANIMAAIILGQILHLNVGEIEDNLPNAETTLKEAKRRNLKDTAKIIGLMELSVEAGAPLTQDQLDAATFIMTPQFGDAWTAPITMDQVDVVAELVNYEAPLPMQQEVVWALQTGWNDGAIPSVAEVIKVDAGMYDFYFTSLEEAVDPAAGAGVGARLFDDNAGFGSVGTTGFRVTKKDLEDAGLDVTRLTPGSVVVFSELDVSTTAGTVIMSEAAQHPKL